MEWAARKMDRDPVYLPLEYLSRAILIRCCSGNPELSQETGAELHVPCPVTCLSINLEWIKISLQLPRYFYSWEKLKPKQCVFLVVRITQSEREWVIQVRTKPASNSPGFKK